MKKIEYMGSDTERSRNVDSGVSIVSPSPHNHSNPYFMDVFEDSQDSFDIDPSYYLPPASPTPSSAPGSPSNLPPVSLTSPTRLLGIPSSPTQSTTSFGIGVANLMSSFMDESTYVEEPEVVDGTPQIPRFGWSDSDNISCVASETEPFSVVTAPISEVDTSVGSRNSKKIILKLAPTDGVRLRFRMMSSFISREKKLPSYFES